MSTFLTSYPEGSWPWGYTIPSFEPPDPEPDPVPNPIPEREGFFQRASYNDGGGDRYLFLTPTDMRAEYPTDARLIGGWGNDGEIIAAVHSDYAELIRPFGNDAGVATDKLDYSKFAGHSLRSQQEVAAADTLREYPSDNQPFVVTMERRYDNTPGWEG